MAFAAFVLFVIAGVLNGAGTHTNTWFSPLTLVCAGLACIAISGRIKP